MICTLCLEKEGKMFEGMKAPYCDECHKAKKAAWGVVSEIIPGLHLSGMREAETWTGGARLCVHEDTPTYSGGMHIPVLSKKPNSFKDRTGAIASFDALDEVALVISGHILSYQPLLVHCVGGVERSPLALAWFLSGSRKGQIGDLDKAYTFLKSKRQVVSQRKFWLPDYE